MSDDRDRAPPEDDLPARLDSPSEVVADAQARMLERMRSEPDAGAASRPPSKGDDATVSRPTTMREPSSHDVAPGFVVKLTWKLVKLLGRGGFGSVYEAIHLELGDEKKAAIKFLHSDALGDEVLARFEQEAKVASRLSNQHVAHVYDFGRLSDGAPYLVMEKLEGETLATRLKRGPMELSDVRSLALQLCEGLAVVHTAGIVHRDLKPANIFLCRDPTGREIVKIIDFGICKAETTLTQTGQHVGSLPYMSPEMLSDRVKDVDRRADIHALGVILYEAMAGRPAYKGPGVGQYVAQIRSPEYPPRVSSLRDEVPAAVDRVLERAYAKHADDRFADVGAFKDAFLAALDGVEDEAVDTTANDLASISFRFVRGMDAEQSAGDSELAVVATAGESAPRSSLDVLEHGLDAAARAPTDEIRAIVLSSNPTLDEMLAAELLRRLAAGERIPSAMKAFAHYAAVLREGLVPRDVPFEHSLQGMFLAARSTVARDGKDVLEEPERAELFLAEWRRIFEVIWTAAREGRGPDDPDLFRGNEFAREHAYLASDARVYRQDVLRGERWLISIPEGPERASALFLRRPRSVLFKQWARTDEDAPTGGCYLLLVVEWPDNRWVISTDPVQRQPIRSLATALQAADSDSEWFDGAPFAHTLVASPRSGTKLTEDEVLATIKRWCSARSAGPEAERPWRGVVLGSAVLALAIGAATAAWYFRRDDTPRDENSTSSPTGAKGKPLAHGQVEKLLASSDGPHTMTHYALVAGVCGYPDEMALRSPCRDARAMRDLLVESYGYDRSHIIYMVDRPESGEQTDGKPTAHDLKQRIQQFTKRFGDDENSTFLFYYSGHGGFTLGAQTNFGLLQPSGFFTEHADQPDDFRGWDMQRIITDLPKYVPSRHIMLVLDNCYAGWGGAKGAEDLDDSLWSLWSKPARVVLTAAKKGQQAWEDEHEQNAWVWQGHSAFTAFVLAGLRPDAEGAVAADSSADGVVTAEELYRYVGAQVADAVRSTKNATQTPEYFRKDSQFPERGQFVFVPKARK